MALFLFNAGAHVVIMLAMKPSLLYLLLLVVGTGCYTEQRAYQVSVHNQLAQPITCWMVKEDGPQENGWLSPEDIGVANPVSDDRLPDVIVPAGKTASCGPILGKFDKERGRAYLRVYAGTPTLTEMLAIGRNSMSRLDLLLEPGPNAFTIDAPAGILTASKTAATQPSPQPAPQPLHQLP